MRDPGRLARDQTSLTRDENLAAYDTPTMSRNPRSYSASASARSALRAM